MIAKGTIVEIYEDPFTMQRKEGNATVIQHLLEIEPGVNQYRVHFIGDVSGLNVTRTIVEKPQCVCCDPIHAGDNKNCLVHSAHWVGGEG